MNAKKRQKLTHGIYLRRKTFWVWYILDGTRYYVNLKTHDELEAIKLAKVVRGTIPEKQMKSGWDQAIKKYIAEKRKGVRPKHLAGRRLRSFRPETCPRVESCLKVFAGWCECSFPHMVKLDHLQKYYNARRKKSEAGARSTIATIQAFLDHIECLPGRVIFSSDRKPEARQVVVSMEDSNKWIADCSRPGLRFVLFCGFHAGLRKSEIKHARPEWFDLTRRVLTVPGKEKQLLPSGKFYDWVSKDTESRQIPLSKSFCGFLEGFLPSCRKFCLVGRRSKDGLSDFRLPFERLVAQQERTDCTLHTMRHSWISELCNSGNHSITEVSAWSGDTIETIESNYWKKRVKTGDLDSTMLGKRSRDEQEALIRDIAERMKGKSEEEMQDQIREAVTAALNIVSD